MAPRSRSRFAHNSGKGNPVIAILKGDSRTEIEIDDAAKDHLVGVLQAL